MKLLFIITCIILNFQTYAQTGLHLIKQFPAEGSTKDGDYLVSPVNLEFKNNVFFVADWRDNNIKIFDHEGNYLRKIGRHGEGPGEFVWPHIIAVNEKKSLLYCDQRGGSNAISIFNIDGKFIKKVKTYIPIIDFTCMNEHIIAATFNEDSNTLFEMYDAEFKLLKKFGSLFLKEKDVEQIKNHKRQLYGRGDFSIFKDTIYYCYDNIPYYQAINMRGEVMRTIKYDLPKWNNQYLQNVEGAKKGWDKNGAMHVLRITYGAQVYNNRIYALDFNAKDELEVFVFKLNGTYERKIVFKFTKDKLKEGFGSLRFKKIIEGKFYFIDITNSVVKIFEERKL